MSLGTSQSGYYRSILHRPMTVRCSSNKMIEIEAKSVNTNKFGIVSVSDREEVKAGLEGILTVNGKRALVVRGNKPGVIVGQVYTRFLQEVDQAGEPFAFSRERRGLVERDPIFNRVVKVTPERMRQYLLAWFQPCELLQATNGPVLILVKDISLMAINLWRQDRFISNVAPMFSFVD
jgi:hypothetical protein